MADSATIVVQFGVAPGSDASGHLSAEVDTREGGLNGGQSSFAPGSDVYLLAYRTANVSITDVLASAGSITQQAGISVTVTEDLNFEDGRTASLSKPVAGASLDSVQWWGNDLGALTVQDDKMSVQAASRGVAVARVTYTVAADVFRLASPASINGQTTYPILVVVKGVAS